MQYAQSKGLFNLNARENGLSLPSTAAEAQASGLPRHFGAHPEYSGIVGSQLARLEKRWNAGMTDDQLRSAIRELQGDLRSGLTKGSVPLAEGANPYLRMLGVERDVKTARYLLMRYDALVPGDFAQFRSPLPGLDEYRLGTGQRVADRYRALDLRITAARPMPDFLALPFCYIVSSKLRDLLTQEAVNAEWLPINIWFKGELLPSRYYIINALEVLPAMDMVNSDYSTYSEASGGGLKGISRLVLDENVMADLPLVDVTPAALLACRRDVAERVSSGGCTGIRFTEVDEYKCLPQEPFSVT
jgi:hypothetical protein